MPLKGKLAETLISDDSLKAMGSSYKILSAGHATMSSGKVTNGVPKSVYKR